MRNPFDQFVKRLVRKGFSPGGRVETEAEVTPDARRVELPRTRDTLLVRLMGAGMTLQRALADVRDLPREAPEVRLAVPILVRLRFEIRADPGKQTKIDREFLMNAKEVDRYLAGLEEKGRSEGRKEAVLEAYEARFGAPTHALVAAVEGETDEAAVRSWLVMVTTRSAEEVAAALSRPATRKPAPKTRGRRATAGRRAAASR